MDDTRDDCGTCRPLLARLAGDTLSEADRRVVGAHVAACETCRREALALDPALLFTMLRGRPLPERVWEGFDRDLRARIAAASRRPAPARLAARIAALASAAKDAVAWAPGPAIWAAPAVMVLVLGVTVAVLRPDAFVPGPRAPRVGALPSPYAPPGGTARPAAPRGPAGAPQPGRQVMGPVPALLGGAGDPPALEEVASPSARVYRFDAADGGAESIYFVVDESIEF